VNIEGLIGASRASAPLQPKFFSCTFVTELPSFAQYADRGDLPLAINRAQSYYWSRTWQHDEAESLREIAEGNVEHFTNGTDAVRWLLSPDD
jgi:hypothetical protein